MDNKWINFEDELPTLEEETVLVCFGKFGGSLGTVRVETLFWDINGKPYYVEQGATHWHRLPDPPEPPEGKKRKSFSEIGQELLDAIKPPKLQHG